ncbi:hypothetical protein N7462_010170 [Penicillium macrosclerotiorum]|uniref:uncharacterized protein n=1 Tax=Penicillium macrosclerotiorum TaxID=303699 RepID=UPI002547A8F4|nr:uncharacterized protein N7462_010170 [Penicillium macrosclerotiorum]KAJ5669100.1 hypothetical protein N7462_010170 [Penicillium macrosclerotiorum]
MMFHLFSRSTEGSISAEKRNVAIAELVLFSTVQFVQFSLRYIQEWRYWHHKKRKNPFRCAFYSWFSMIGLLSQIRIANNAMILSTSYPTSSMLIAESSMQSVGLSPLLFEVSLVLLRCGQAGEFGPGKSKYPKPTRVMLHGFRLPIIVAIVMTVVGRIIQIHGLAEAGSVLLVVAYAFVCGLIAWLAGKSRSILSASGYRGILVTSFTLPFLLVRIIYFVLLTDGSPKFNPANGDVGILAGMGLLMEILIVSLLVMARTVTEPISSPPDSKMLAISDDLEPSRN